MFSQLLAASCQPAVTMFCHCELSHKWPKKWSDVNRLKKVDLVSLVEVLGVAVNHNCRAAEIREVVKDALFPAGEQDDRQDMRNLGIRTEEELQMLAAKTGAEVPPQATHATLRFNIRKAVMQKSAPRFTVEFGQHRDITYAEVMTSFPSYADWC